VRGRPLDDVYKERPSGRVSFPSWPSSLTDLRSEKCPKKGKPGTYPSLEKGGAVKGGNTVKRKQVEVRTGSSGHLIKVRSIRSQKQRGGNLRAVTGAGL